VTLAADLASWIGDRTARPFDWASNHCGHFAAAWVLECTGFDPFRRLPPLTNARSVRRLVHNLGGLANVCTRALGQAPIAATLAQTGDLVLIQVPPTPDGVGEALGICSGRQAIFMEAGGVVCFLDMALARCAWRVQRAAA